jgi:hypothetical protein
MQLEVYGGEQRTCAPVAPAIALPHGGSGVAFVGGAIWLSEAQCLVPSLSDAAYASPRLQVVGLLGNRYR